LHDALPIYGCSFHVTPSMGCLASRRCVRLPCGSRFPASACGNRKGPDSAGPWNGCRSMPPAGVRRLTTMQGRLTAGLSLRPELRILNPDAQLRVFLELVHWAEYYMSHGLQGSAYGQRQIARGSRPG